MIFIAPTVMKMEDMAGINKHVATAPTQRETVGEPATGPWGFESLQRCNSDLVMIASDKT